MIKWIKHKCKISKKIDKYYTRCLKNTLRKNRNGKKKIEREIHDTYYSHLLFDYVLNVRKTLKQKRVLKVMFFGVIMTIFILTFCCFLYSTRNVANIIKIMDKNKDSNNKKIAIEVMTIIIPLLFSLIVAFIKIPEIIAKYLFNIKEDEYMTSIIQNLQNYDKSIYSIEKKIKEQLEDINTNNDNEILTLSDENTI